MNSISKKAADVDKNSSEARTKNTKSVVNEKHAFSKSVAELKDSKGNVLGHSAAIILSYISAKVRLHGQEIGGKKWVRINLDHITLRYPYFGRSTVDEAILRLKRFGMCEIENLNEEFGRWRCDRTRCYHVAKKWMDASQEEPRYFDPGVAASVGVPAAAIFANFSHWIHEAKGNDEEEVAEISAAKLAKLLPFSKSTIKRALKKLHDYRLISPVADEICRYRMGSKADMGGSKPDMEGSKADMGRSKPDNYVFRSNIIDSLEKCSKEKPAALLCKLPPCVEKDNDLISSSATSRTMNGGDEQHGDKTNLLSSAFFKKGIKLVPDGEVKDITDVWNQLDRIEALHAHNQDYARLLDKSERNFKDHARRSVSHICISFFKELTVAEILELRNIKYEDDLFNLIKPSFREFFNKHPETNNFRTSVIYCFGALEAIVGAFAWRSSDPYEHGSDTLQYCTYLTYLEIFKVVHEEAVREQAEAMEESRDKCASRDED